MRAGTFGRVAGVAAALGVATLWAVFAFRNPYAPPREETQLIGGLMMVAALVAAMAASRGAHLAMYLLFVPMFVPVGFYVMLGAGIFQAIGWLELLYLGCAVLVHSDVVKGRAG
ncbi:MAG: hypothetical protein FJW23_09475 [Acidimicrobiia bacterium]|nr:hypothetical protein [Acidimicrobiia bacterium]